MPGVEEKPKIKLKSSALSDKKTVEREATKLPPRPFVLTRAERIESLKCYETIKDMLIAGRPIGKIAKFVFDDHPDDFRKLGITLSLFEKWLGDYRKKIAKTEAVAVRVPEVIEKAAEEIEESIDEIKELADLYGIQKERIGIDFKTEKKINKLFKSTGNEVSVAMNILRTSASIKADFGLVKRGVGLTDADRAAITDFGPKYGKVDVAGILSDPEKRRKLLNVAELLLSKQRLEDKVNKTSPKEQPVTA